MKINLSSHFKRAYKKLPLHVQKDFDQKVTKFAKNPNNPLLKTHKLKGKYQSCLAFQLKAGFRVLFEFSAKNTVDLLDIGPHDIYKKQRS